VSYDSGPSQASGLGTQTADASGKVSWSWTVGRNTKTGEWPIEIACFKGERDGTLSTSFRVR
jgi:micrococcal nuclease